VAPEGLSQEQRLGIQGFFFNERGYIHSCLDFLLQSDLGNPLPPPRFSGRPQQSFWLGDKRRTTLGTSSSSPLVEVETLPFLPGSPAIKRISRQMNCEGSCPMTARG